jgi:NADPH-dependent 2,4-dienoyl-CoA reductase/sulfur reductase-like enzyme
VRPPGIVIVGGGLAGERCAETLRARGYDGSIRVVCAEEELPYDRPPLSKELLAGSIGDEAATLRPGAWYVAKEIELILGRRARSLDPVGHRIELDNGLSVRYEKLLIATGSRARRLPNLEGFSNVHYLRTLADARRLRERMRPGSRLVVVGAGFIGQEVAATARRLGVDVTLIEALPAPLSAILGEDVGRWFVDLHRSEGVEVLLSARVLKAHGNGSVEELVLENGRRLGCDAAVIGIGVAPAAEWLAGSGLEPDGVLTDAAGRTSIEDVFAAGDVTRAFDPRLGTHTRTEHWDAAARQGAAAAKAMLGADPGPVPLPSFWSDQYGVRVQYVGHAERADEHQFECDRDGREFRVVYTRAGRPVAGLVVDQPRAVVALRREIELCHTRSSNRCPNGHNTEKEFVR